MTRHRTVALGWIAAAVLWIAPLQATSTVMGIEPGRNLRAQAEAVFGRPLSAASDSRASYAGQGGAAGIDILYVGGVVDRIDLRFAPALAAEAVQRQLGLPTPTAAAPVDGRLADYYGGSRTLVLTHETDAASSAVSMVSYLSPAAFARATAGLTVRDTPPSAAVVLANPNDGPLILQYNPAACTDVYLWAQREHDAARRAKNVERRQAVLAIVIASQRGECGAATALAAEYRKKYRQ